MTWLKIDDGWRNNPKVAGLSMAARGLWVTCANYCAEQLTDGHITRKQVRREGGHAREIRQLLDAALWVECDDDDHGDCIQFHDWLDHNPSRTKVLSDRQNAADRKAKSRAKRAAEEAGNLADSRQKPGRSPADSRQKSGRSLAEVRQYSGVENDENSDNQQQPEQVTCDPRARARIPTRPDPTRIKGLPAEGGLSIAQETTPKCDLHKNNPNPPNCGRCADARRTAEATQAEFATMAAARRQQEQAARADRTRQEIDACPMCDNRGYRTGRVCSHDPDEDARRTRGIAEARKALRKDPA